MILHIKIKNNSLKKRECCKCDWGFEVSTSQTSAFGIEYAQNPNVSNKVNVEDESSDGLIETNKGATYE